LDTLPGELKRPLSRLKEVDFELAYLALLTNKGLKPLSRWEKSLNDEQINLLRQMGLHVKRITRTVKTGRQVFETIFSRLQSYVHLYEERFQNTAIDKSAATVRFEGFLFGYPPCCTEEYVQHPYAPNDLSPDSQKIIFHWACKGCKVTPKLLEQYRNIHQALSAV
jgi:hypothetical protein